MKKNDLVLNIGIGVVVVVIIAIFLFKFVINKTGKEELFKINNIEKIVVSDLNGNEIKFFDLLDKEDDTFILIFDLRNCYSCIFKGIENLKSLKKSGKSCFGLAVHELLDELNGWSANHDFSPFFLIKKSDFFENIHSMNLPVFIKISNGKVESFRFITP